MDDSRHTLHSQIWCEQAQADNPYATAVAYCHGYDVYGDLLGQARWVEMLFLLLRGDAPTPAQADLLETLALALANPGPRDAAVHAAMCGGTGGSTAAACLMAALAVGAGQSGGAREVFLCMQDWHTCGADLAAWQAQLQLHQARRAGSDKATGSIWPRLQHAPGFDPHSRRCALPLTQTLTVLAGLCPASRLSWLAQQRPLLEQAAGQALAWTGLAATAFAELGFTPEQGEMLYLLLRLPGAAAHALEQAELGYKKFPFGKIELEPDQEQK